jgi:hypothetical protein
MRVSLHESEDETTVLYVSQVDTNHAIADEHGYSFFLYIAN